MLLEIWIDNGHGEVLRAARNRKPFAQWRLHRPLARESEAGAVVQRIVNSGRWVLITISRAREDKAIHEDAIYEKPRHD